MEIVEPKAIHNIYDGVIEGKDVKHYDKVLSQIKDIYQNTDGVDEETHLYTVYSYEEGRSDQQGNLNWGLTILEPVCINDECNMTRGHFHSDPNCAEFYFGIEGEGLLLLMDRSGKMWAEKVFKGSLHHIDGSLAHRLVNTGDTQCKIGACWPTTAGHDYESIEKNEFPYRIFKRNGKIEFEKR